MTILTAVTVGLQSCLSRDVEDLQSLGEDQWDAFKDVILGALGNILVGSNPGARNVCGLRNGYVLCYWDSRSKRLLQGLLSCLRKEDTQFKMFLNGISVIHVYTSVSLDLIEEPFWSSIVEASLVGTFQSGEALGPTFSTTERLLGPSTVSSKPAISPSVPKKRRRSNSSESSVLERLNTQALEARNEAHQARRETELLVQERARLMAHNKGLDAELRDLRPQQLTMHEALQKGDDETRKLKQGPQSRMEIGGYEDKGREEEIIALETMIKDQDIALKVSKSEVDQMKTRISQLEKAIADAETQQTVLGDGQKSSLQAEKETFNRLMKSQQSLQAFQKEHVLLKNKVAQADEARRVTENRLEEKEQDVENVMKALISFRQEAEELVSKERNLRESAENKLDTVRQSVKGVSQLLGE
ncbi:hypothetical protein DFH11DRAFT_677610 [Phellopilus nigrolimitatus]|nr:hypothetical protein DFH11DRAFT_677610 [Phellopilus nigrolimitatus]